MSIISQKYIYIAYFCFFIACAAFIGQKAEAQTPRVVSSEAACVFLPKQGDAVWDNNCIVETYHLHAGAPFSSLNIRWTDGVVTHVALSAQDMQLDWVGILLVPAIIDGEPGQYATT